MSRPIVGFPDPQLAARNLLRDVLAERDEDVARGATVTTRVPTGKGPSSRVPIVLVRAEDRRRDARLNGSAVVRVTVWHRDEGLAERLASLCEALLLSRRGHGIRAVSPEVGPTSTTDNGTGLAFFTATVRLRPETY